MAIEIFICYRRAGTGGHARHLHGQLVRQFAGENVFFDVACLESGDVLSRGIDAAVRECSVLLALIGPDWMTVELNGQRRLDDPLDFVRMEIDLALRLGKRVIPVLFDNVAPPKAADLPAVLAPLANRVAHTMGFNSYDADLLSLVQMLAKLPGVSPPRHSLERRGERIVADRDKLPVLCNRSVQADAVAEAVLSQLRGPQRRPMVLLVHGRPDEAHHAFVDRLEGFSLPRLLKGRAAGSGVQFVRINDPVPIGRGRAGFDSRLRERLGEALDLRIVEDDATLLRQMRQLKLSALIAVVTWRATELTEDPILPLQRVFEYWAEFPTLGPELLVGCIVCLKYDRIGTPSWFSRLLGKGQDPAKPLRRAIERSSELYAPDPRVAWCVTSELPSVTVADLDRWVSEVAELIGSFSVSEERLQSIIGGEKRPMQAVLPELGKLVPAP